MRAAGEIYFEILKSRNSGGVGQRILLGWDPISLLVKSLKNAKSQLQLTKKSKTVILGTEGTVFTKKSEDGGVLNLMNT